MWKLALPLLLAAVALPAPAATPVTVQQLEQKLAEAHGRRDGELARELSELELTERAGSARLARWEASLPGDKAREALIALVDEAAFLSPPADEIPTTPMPDVDTQRRLMSQAVDYVGRIIPKSPDFIATRTTVRYEDTPMGYRTTLTLTGKYQPLQPVDRFSETVLVRDGKEVVNASAAAKAAAQTKLKRIGMPAGLKSWGEFGPILGLILVDAAKSQLAWSHWERGAAGPQAVFRFVVPQGKSHYEVRWCCVTDQVNKGFITLHVFHEFAGYHGELAVDAVSGAVLRLTLEADLKPDAPLVRADLTIEYGPVEIGGRTYICPVKSVSLSRAPAQLSFRPRAAQGSAPPSGGSGPPLRTSVNDTRYGQYHLFRGETRILTGDSAELDAYPNPGVRTKPAASAADSTEIAVTPSDAEAPSPDKTITIPLSSGTLASVPPPAAAPSAPDAPAEEISVAEATSLPDTPATPSPDNSENAFVLRTAARLVDVGVVAIDTQGNPVTNLTRRDFEIADDGDRQQIQMFTPPGSGQAAQSPGKSGQPAFSNRRAIDVDGNSGSTGYATILLVDVRQLAFADLNAVREQMLRFLGALPSGEQVGFYWMNAQRSHVLLEPSADHAALAAKLSQWMPSVEALAAAQSEDPVQTPRTGAPDGKDGMGPANVEPGPAPQVSSTGGSQQPVANGGSGQGPLAILVDVARRLAAIPGHKNLVWVTGADVPAGEMDQPGVNGKKGRLIEGSVLRAQETMSDARISLYPLDASKPAESATAGSIHDSALQDPTTEMAEATGGRVLHLGGDLASQLNSVVAEGRSAYLLSFMPDVPADGHYHRLQVRLTGQRDITLRFRAGYLYQREPSTLNERFREAVWQPVDATEIAISASPSPAPKGMTMKLNIAAADLDLAQQGDVWTDKVDVFVVDRAGDGQQAQVTGQTLTLRLKAATYRKALEEGILFDQPVEAHADAGAVRIIVVDENSGRMGSITEPAAALSERP
jgi:VWFA-related protein